MRYRCVLKQDHELWLSENKLYEGDICVSPKEYSGGVWLLLKRADDGFPAYARLNQFEKYKEERDNLAV